MRLTERDLEALIDAAVRVGADAWDPTAYEDPDAASDALKAALRKLTSELQRRTAKRRP